MIERKAITFSNYDNEILVGILETPQEPREDLAVMLLSPGVKMRVGPSHLYHAVSKVFLDQGFRVLRFDFNGLGDSEGRILEKRLVKVYNSIVDGRYVPDTQAAIDWIETTLGCRKVIAAGLCGGAMTGLLTAQADSRIAALVGIGIPVSFEGGEQDYWRFVTDGELKGMQPRYLRSMRSLKSWIRFVTFRSDYRIIWRIVQRLVRERLSPSSPVPSEPAGPRASNVNPKFLPAFRAMLEKHRPILLMFGEKDRWAHEFHEKFEITNKALFDQYGSYLQKVIVSKANHILSSPEARAEIGAVMGTWLQTTYPRRSVERATAAST